MSIKKIFSYVVFFVILFIVWCIIGTIRDEKRRKEHERMERRHEKIRKVIKDVFYNQKEFSELNKLSLEEKADPFYLEQLNVETQVTLNYYLAFFLNYEIDFKYFAGILIWISECPQIGKRFEPMVANLSQILAGRSYFDKETDFRERIDKLAEVLEGNSEKFKKQIVEFAEVIRKIPLYSVEVDYRKKFEQRTSDIVSGHYLSGENLDRVLKIVTDMYFKTPVITFIPAYMVYFATVKERTEEIIEVEKELYFLYSLFYQPRTESDELKKKGILFRETKELLIVKSLIYMRSGLLEKVNEELNNYLYEITDKDMIDDIQEEFLMLQKFYQEYGMKKQEEMIMIAMLDRGMVLSSELEMRLQYLHRGFKNTIKVFNDTNEMKGFAYDYRALSWKRQEFAQYVDEVTLQRQILQMPLVIDSWEKNINEDGVKWDITFIKENVDLLLKENFENEFSCQCLNAGAVTEVATELEPSVLITENEGKHRWLAFLITGEQVTKRQVAIAIYVIFMPDKLELSNMKKEKVNLEILNWVMAVKEKQNPKLATKIQTIQTLLIEKLEQCINQSAEENIYS